MSAAVVAHTLWTSDAPAMAYRLYAGEWHVNRTVTTGVFAIYRVVVALTLIGFGDTSGHIGRRAMVPVGLGAPLVGTLPFAMAPDVLWLFAARPLMGVGLTAGLSTAAAVEFAAAGPAANITPALSATRRSVYPMIDRSPIALMPFSTLPYATPLGGVVLRETLDRVMAASERHYAAPRFPASESGVGKDAMIIDAWGQHPTLRFDQDPMFDSLRRWTKTSARTEQLPVSATIAAMDRGGAEKMLISAWTAPRNIMISNDEVAGFVAEAPHRLMGVGSVDISKPMNAVREVKRCVRELGFKAIRVLPWLWEAPPTDRRFYPVYVACCEEGVPFCTQIGHTGPLMPSEVGRPIYLDQVALEFPDLVIVAGHIGYPWTEEAIAIAIKHQSVYIDTSAYRCGAIPRPWWTTCAATGHRRCCSAPTIR